MKSETRKDIVRWLKKTLRSSSSRVIDLTSLYCPDIEVTMHLDVSSDNIPRPIQRILYEKLRENTKGRKE